MIQYITTHIKLQIPEANVTDVLTVILVLNLQAAWVAGQYADIQFSDQRHFTTALHCVVAALTDSELPVRVDSVVALRTFVEACKGTVTFFFLDKVFHLNSTFIPYSMLFNNMYI
jgi:hypothetical protein